MKPGLQVMKIAHHHANGYFDWLISVQQSVNPFERENFRTVWEIQRHMIALLQYDNHAVKLGLL